jgi:hypothetical protein
MLLEDYNSYVIRDSIGSTSNTEKTSFNAKGGHAMTYNAAKALLELL